MKFNVGDRVKIIGFEDQNEIPEGGENLLKGATGRVIKIDKDYIYPYEVKFDDARLDEFGCDFWHESELELFNKKEKHGRVYALMMTKFIFLNGYMNKLNINPGEHGKLKYLLQSRK